MIEVFSFSQAREHAINEDAFAVQRHPGDPDAWLCCLADGQGGRAGGARAAQLACRVTMETAMRIPVRTLMAPSAWYDVLELADRAVRDDPAAGITTLVGFCIFGGFIAGQSCGDSAVLLTSMKMPPLELTAHQSKVPPVGSGSARFQPFGAGLAENWKVLALSDGVWKYVGWERVRLAATTLRGEWLINDLKANARMLANQQFQDDVTVVLLEETQE